VKKRWWNVELRERLIWNFRRREISEGDSKKYLVKAVRE